MTEPMIKMLDEKSLDDVVKPMPEKVAPTKLVKLVESGSEWKRLKL